MKALFALYIGRHLARLTAWVVKELLEVMLSRHQQQVLKTLKLLMKE